MLKSVPHGDHKRLAAHEAIPVPDLRQALRRGGMEARPEMPAMRRLALRRRFAG